MQTALGRLKDAAVPAGSSVLELLAVVPTWVLIVVLAVWALERLEGLGLRFADHRRADRARRQLLDSDDPAAWAALAGVPGETRATRLGGARAEVVQLPISERDASSEPPGERARLTDEAA